MTNNEMIEQIIFVIILSTFLSIYSSVKPTNLYYNFLNFYKHLIKSWPTPSKSRSLYRPEDLHLIVGKILGDGCAVLVRAVDPLEGIEYMTDQRSTSTKTKKVGLKPHELCNSPAKLCMAYQLNKQHTRYSLCTWKSLWIEDDASEEDFKIVQSTRIGINSCGTEWAGKLLRYYVYGNKSVSKRDKKAEMKIS